MVVCYAFRRALAARKLQHKCRVYISSNWQCPQTRPWLCFVEKSNIRSMAHNSLHAITFFFFDSQWVLWMRYWTCISACVYGCFGVFLAMLIPYMKGHVGEVRSRHKKNCFCSAPLLKAWVAELLQYLLSPSTSLLHTRIPFHLLISLLCAMLWNWYLTHNIIPTLGKLISVVNWSLEWLVQQ